MKVFQMNGKDNVLEFTNYERLSEETLFRNVMEKLRRNPDIVVGIKKTGPSEDSFNCTISGEPFVLYFDIDYGPSIVCQSQEAIKSLNEYFNS